MHRGRVVLGTVLGGALAVAAATQVNSWSPDGSAWDPAAPPSAEPTTRGEFVEQPPPSPPPGCEPDPAERAEIMAVVEAEPGYDPETHAVVVLCDEED